MLRSIADLIVVKLGFNLACTRTIEALYVHEYLSWKSANPVKNDLSTCPAEPDGYFDIFKVKYDVIINT